MSRNFSRLATCAAAAAALSLVATPAAAHDRWHRHRGGGVDAGDVIAGVLILGGIAAIASAASKSNRDRDYREDDRYREPYRGSYPEERYDYRAPGSRYSGGGLDNAVDMCVGEVERGPERVVSVDNVARTGDGWQVSGQIDRGGQFDCSIDNDGRIRNVDIGGSYGRWEGSGYEAGSSNRAASDRQWNDEDYARARAQAGYSDPYSG